VGERESQLGKISLKTPKPENALERELVEFLRRHVDRGYVWKVKELLREYDVVKKGKCGQNGCRCDKK
jgi:hypothetical protein